MLANDGAQVYSIDINSIYLFKGGRLHKCSEETTPETCVRSSKIIVTGVPTKQYRMPTEWVPEGSAVVNVASFKNVNEEELLKIPGVTYVPMVGKVTVAMLERNLMRLFENYHHPNRTYSVIESKPNVGDKEEKYVKLPWYGTPVQAYTALVATALLAIVVINSAKH